MKESLTSEVVVSVLTFLQIHFVFAWGILVITGLWVLSKVFSALAEFGKVWKPGSK